MRELPLPDWASRPCDDCGAPPAVEVCRSAAGHYIGQWCRCGPRGRLSGYFASKEEARRALESGEFALRTDL